MISKIILSKGIKVDRNYNNVLSYTNTDMLDLMRDEDHLVAYDDRCSFLHPTKSIMVNFGYEKCLQSNYIAFQNPDYSNKWFFAWIDDVIYRSDKNTEITFTIDAWTTWYGYWTKKTCYVERQHVNDDSIGSNTIPENLYINDIIEESSEMDASFDTSRYFWVAIQSSYTIKDSSDGTDPLPSNNGDQYDGIAVYNKTIYGTPIFLFAIDPEDPTNSFGNLEKFIKRTNFDKHIEDIENMFVIPDALIKPRYLNAHQAKAGTGKDSEFIWYTLAQTVVPEKLVTNIAKRTSFSNISVRNNKCYTYPYNYLYVTNNAGSSNIYKYENFSTTNCQFENQLALTIGVSGRVIPKYYKNMEYNEDESLPLGKFPTCAWSSDAFTNWLTQNSVNIPVGIALVVGGLALAGATGGASAGAAAAAGSSGALSGVSLGTTLAVSGASQVASGIGTYNESKLLPNVNGGQATGDVVWSNGNSGFIFRQMRADNESMKIIDDYFTKYGYAIKSLQSPNITGRRYWNYIEIGKTEEIGYGDVPSKFMEIINNSCRKGVTIWHSHSNLGDYSLNNTIL